MSARTARVQLKAPFRWTAIIRSHTSSVISWSATSPAMPASFTRMCTGPSAAWIRSTAASTLAALATSASTATARRWSRATSSATCRPPPWSRSSTATSAPSRARRRQIARPIPEAPPVTTAFRPPSPMPEPLVGRASRRQTVLRERPMHLDYTPEQQALREELRAYFARLVTPEYQAELAGTEGGGPLYLKTVRQLGADGWLGIGWPREYGGQGRTPIEQFIFFDEAARAGIMLPTLTINAVAPAIMEHGTAAQKARFLPAILRGECHFAIGYTEPSSGTDLASLRTRAVRDGDAWVINGAKLFTSQAEFADYIWLAARTDPEAPKHKGISMFVVPP